MSLGHCDNVNWADVLKEGRKQSDRHADLKQDNRKFTEQDLKTEEEAALSVQASSLGVNHIVKNFSPNQRLANSPLYGSRDAVQQLLQNVGRTVGTEQGIIPSDVPLIQSRNALRAKANVTLAKVNEQYEAAIKAGQATKGRKGARKFGSDVVKALRKDLIETNPNQFIAAGAKAMRATMDEVLEMGIRAGLWGPEATVGSLKAATFKTAQGYVTRVIDQRMLMKKHDEVIELLMRELDTDYNGASEIVNGWMNMPRGRSPVFDGIDGMPTSAKATKKRGVIIQDHLLDELGILVNDPRKILDSYINSVGFDAVLVNATGDTAGDTLIGMLKWRGNHQIERSAAKDRPNLRKRLKKDAKDARHVIEELRGLNKMPENTASRVGHRVRQGIGITKLGMVTLTSLPDIARPILMYGMTPTIRDGWMPFASHVAKLDAGKGKLLRENMQHALLATDRMTGSISQADLGFLDEGFGGFMDVAFDASNKVNGIRYWNDIMDTNHAFVLHGNMEKQARKLNRGGSMSQREIGDYAQLRISQDDLRAIGKQIDAHGARASDWDDPALAGKYYRALNQHGATMLNKVEPGDRPISMVSNEFAAMMLQFHSFVMSSSIKTLLPLAQNLASKDAGAAFKSFEYLFVAMNVAFLADTLKRKLRGDDREFTAAELGVRAFDYSGAPGMIPKLFSVANGVTGHALEQAIGIDTRRSGTLEEFGNTFFGASFNFGADGYRSLNAFSDFAFRGEEPNESDARAFLGLLPLYNGIQIQGGLRATEAIRDQ